MNFIEPIAGFEFDDQNIVDQQVCKILANNNAVVNNIEWLLDLDLQPEFSQFVGESVLVDLFEGNRCLERC